MSEKMKTKMGEKSTKKAEKCIFKPKINLLKLTKCGKCIFRRSFSGLFWGCFGHFTYFEVILGVFLVFFRSFLGVFWSFFPYIFKVYLTLSGDKSVLERFKMHFEKGDLRVFV